MIPVPVAVVCPKTCGTLAEDASIIASHNPICHICQEADMSENQLFNWEGVSFPSLGSKSFLDSIRRALSRAGLRSRTGPLQAPSCEYS